MSLLLVKISLRLHTMSRFTFYPVNSTTHRGILIVQGIIDPALWNDLKKNKNIFLHNLASERFVMCVHAPVCVHICVCMPVQRVSWWQELGEHPRLCKKLSFSLPEITLLTVINRIHPKLPVYKNCSGFLDQKSHL